DKVSAVLVLCSQHMYIVDHFTFDAHGQLLSLDPAAAAGAEQQSQFFVSVSARPVSQAWHSEDAQGRDTTEGGPRSSSPVHTPPLSADDVVLQVTKVTKDMLAEQATLQHQVARGAKSPDLLRSAILGGLEPPADDPEDPVLPAAAPRVDQPAV